jgi:hypothetical protein
MNDLNPKMSKRSTRIATAIAQNYTY